MFEDSDIEELIEEEILQTTFGIDSPIDQYGPHLNEELDMQKWQSTIQLSDPRAGTRDVGNWSDRDLEDMSKRRSNDEIVRIHIGPDNFRAGNFIVHGLTPYEEEEIIWFINGEYPKSTSFSNVLLCIERDRSRGVSLYNAKPNGVIKMIASMLLHYGFVLRGTEWVRNTVQET